MKKDIHPEYRPVVFNDLASGTKFFTRSTVKTEKTIEWEDGNTYPLVDVEISSASHRSTPVSSASLTPLDALRSSRTVTRASESASNTYINNGRHAHVPAIIVC